MRQTHPLHNGEQPPSGWNEPGVQEPSRKKIDPGYVSERAVVKQGAGQPPRHAAAPGSHVLPEKAAGEPQARGVRLSDDLPPKMPPPLNGCGEQKAAHVGCCAPQHEELAPPVRRAVQ
eukprot:3186166-Prymnesium_polylepis.1